MGSATKETHQDLLPAGQAEAAALGEVIPDGSASNPPDR
jgi:hypothetical protein